MRFDRKNLGEILKGAEVVVPKDVLNQIFELYSSSVEDYKKTILTQEGDLETVTKERDELKNQKPTNDNEALNELQKKFDDYKKDVENKATKEKLDTSIAEALKKANFGENVIDLLARDKAFESVTVDEKGEIVGLTEAIKTVSTSRADLIVSTQNTKGTKPTTNIKAEIGEVDTSKMSMEEYINYRKR